MRISDWSSDVCSSDLVPLARPRRLRPGLRHRLFRWLPGPPHEADLAARALPRPDRRQAAGRLADRHAGGDAADRSEEHTSELQSLMRISYAVFCLKKKKKNKRKNESHKTEMHQ